MQLLVVCDGGGGGGGKQVEMGILLRYVHGISGFE